MKETGVKVFDVEGIRLDEQFRRADFDRFLAVSAALGVQVLSVIGDDPDEERLIDSFAGICDDASRYNLTIGLEFMPYSRVQNAAIALRILRRAACSNARLLLDLLHVSRTRLTPAGLADIPPALLSVAQLCDAPAAIPTTREELSHTARYCRLLPGTGGIDLRGMVDILPKGLPLTVEIPNTRQMALLGAEEWATRALAATRRALQH